MKIARKKSSVVSILLLIITIVTCLDAVQRPIFVLASDGTTSAERAESLDYGSYIVSMLMSANCGITDVSYLQIIQDTFETIGSSALAPQIDQAINDCINAGVPQQIFEVFSTTAEEATTYVNEVGAENIVNISNEAASAGTNIWASAQNWIQTGVMAAGAGGMVFVESVAPLAVAVAAGVGLGILIDKARNAFVNNIIRGVDVGELVGQSNTGYVTFASWANTTPYYYKFQDGLIACYYQKTTGGYTYGCANFTDGDITGKAYIYNESGSSIGSTSNNVNATTFHTNTTSNDNHPEYGIFLGIRTSSTINSLIRDIKNGVVSLTNHAPDLIGTGGNQNANFNPTNNDVEAPNITQPYNPQQSSMQPIPWDKILPWANTANQNTQNGDTGQQQGEDYQRLIEPYIIPWPYGDPTSPNPLPDPEPAPQPSIIPAPTIEPGQQPEPAPTVAPDQQPYTPTQPELTPVPSLAPDPQADIEKDLVPDTPTKDEGDPLQTVGLKDVFPFCIPWDIYTALTKFNVARQAPHIQGTIDLGLAGEHQIDLDMSVFDNVASLLRTLELIIFIVGLGMATNYLIGRN